MKMNERGLIPDDDFWSSLQCRFTPKCVGHAVRLAGVLNCIEQFSNGKMPGSVLTKHDVEKGIKVALFYMGHAVEAIKTLAIDVFEPRVEVSDHGIYLAQTLESLRPDIDSGKLTVGYIHEKFNEISMPDLHIKTSRAMGSLLRSFGLTILPGKSQANGRSGVKCLSWDALTEKFLKHVHNVLEVRKTSDGASSDLMTSDEECLECPADDYSREDIRDMFEGMSMTKDDGSEPLEGHKGLSGHVSITPQVEDESVIAHEAI